MTIAIRAAGIEDAGAIAHVHVESWRTTYAEIVPDAYLAGLDVTLRARLWREWLSGRSAGIRGGVGRARGGIRARRCESGAAGAVRCGTLLDLLAEGRAKERDRGGAFAGDGQSTAGANFKSMAVWVLEQNRSRSFYEKTGARMAMSKVIEIGGAKLMEVAYAWADLKALTESP